MVNMVKGGGLGGRAAAGGLLDMFFGGGAGSGMFYGAGSNKAPRHCSVGIYSHVHRTRVMDHGICRLTDGGNWDMRQNVRMEAIGNRAFGIKRGGISYRI